MTRHRWLGVVIVLSFAGESFAREPIKLANTPALSPDGSTLAFARGGDIWTVPSAGGAAKQLTRHPGIDRDPEFSPDGKTIAFASDRKGAFHAYTMPAEGGPPTQVGFHSSGYTVEGWTPDGKSLLVNAIRDHHWRDAERFFLIGVGERTAETPLFDASGENGALSPDGKRLLFTREGAPWWRKGYKGSQDSQIWLFDRDANTFTKVADSEGGAHWPLWKPDGQGIYYVGLNKGSLNLRERDLKTGNDKALTELQDDSVVYPCISRDGSTIVFRFLFDLYRFNPTKNDPPTRLDIYNDADATREPIERRVLTQASQVAFSKDGLEVAFTAGGDLWVMDTELKEPKRVTNTPEEERDPVFAPGGESLVFVSDQGGQCDIWRAERGDSAKDWWQNETFKLDKLTQDTDVESDLRWSPEGSKIAFTKVRGDLWVMNPDGKDPKRIVESWNSHRFDWSPDGKWLVYANADQDFNEDIWVVPIDGSKAPFNLSRHPDNESEPVWSPDGKIIAFTGRRMDREVDIYFVYLMEEEDDKTTRARTLEKAVEKIKQGRKKGAKPATSKDATAKTDDKPAADDPKKAPAAVAIDFERIHERIRRISIPDSTEMNLFWSPDSKKLAFTGTVEGKTGVFTVEIPEDLKPKPLSTTVGAEPRWLESGNQIVWLSSGIPATLTPGGKETTFPFRALQEVDTPAKYKAAFELCWRTMRDHWYDEKLGNRNWDAVRRKYVDMAGQSPDRETLATVVNLMLGELNGSHLGFVPVVPPSGGPVRRGPVTPPGPIPGGSSWALSTAHFGLRFEPDYKGPGLKVRDVIPGTPADAKATRILAGEILLAIDGVSVDPALDLTKVLNGPVDRDVRLTIKDAVGKERKVVLRPISFASAQARLYDKWVKENRKSVEDQSKGTLGYLHIRGMDFPSFYRFEEELYAAGAGKSGLVIDVRENGGGSTADHLLTALTQPSHAITVPRGGGPGYPQDRRVYATWNKPIVVLCNQNSFSNAEIFSHAIKTLKRGKIVGVRTAGGVVSTGGTSIMDVGFLRLPTRGWFVIGTGDDMELNGVVPDQIVWPTPDDFAKGQDRQLAKAIEVLMADVKDAAAIPAPMLKKATER